MLVLVLEDAPVGIRAGETPEFKVVAGRISHSLEYPQKTGPDWIVEDLCSVRVLGVEGGMVKIEIRDAWEYMEFVNVSVPRYIGLYCGSR